MAADATAADGNATMSPRGLARLTAAVAAATVAAAGLAGTPEAQVFRSGVDLAGFGVTVVDKKGGLVTDLTRDDFEVRFLTGHW